MTTQRKFNRHAVGKPRSRLVILTVGIGTLLLLALSSYIGYEAANSVPGRSYYDIKAQFDDADNLANHYEVRIGGKRAGQVLKPRIKDGKALVDLRLDSEFGPLRADSVMRIRLRSAVGVRYLEITPGTKGRELKQGETLAASQAVEPVPLDQVLNTFDPRTRDRTQAFLGQLGAGFAGRGEDLNRTLGSAPEFLSRTGRLSEAITDRPGAMGRLIASAQGAAEAFDPVRDTLAQGFDPERRALAPFADKAGELRETLAQASSTLAGLRTDLPATRGLLDQVDGLAREARPTIARAPAALRETTRMLKAANPPLTETDETLAKLDGATGPAIGMLDRVHPVLPQADRAMGDVLPTVTHMMDRSCELSNAFTGWSEYMKWGDAGGSWIRFTLLNTSDALGGSTRSYNGQPRKLLNDNFHVNPYPGPCQGDLGEAGYVTPRAEEAAKGKTYGYGDEYTERGTTK